MSANNKQGLMDIVENAREELLTLSHNIHANPELGYKEYKACKFILNTLKLHGFTIIDNYCGMETSFKAIKKGKGPGPRVSFLAEYDALPEIGHGCGHNIIAACAVGAAIALGDIIGGYDGEVSIIGTPAEEGGGGKILLLERGGFDESDFALMIHPSSGENLIGRGGRAATHVHVAFTGKAAHSAVPSMGVNALNAVVSLFNHLDMLRPTFDSQSNVNGIIRSGGTAANIIPEFASCEFSLRARTLTELENLVETVRRCIAASEALTGARASVEVEKMYAERYPSLPIGEAFKSNMEQLGEVMSYPDPNKMYGSSDIGNVSIKIPVIHDYLNIADESVNAHSVDFTKAAISLRADEICIKGAKGLAMTGLDILDSEAFRREILAFHEKQIPAEYKN